MKNTDNNAAAIEFLTNGVVAPLTALTRSPGETGNFDGGVYRADGTVCNRSLQIKHGYRNSPRPFSELSVRDALSGRHIYCGMLHDWHFGHFIVESTTRLWAIKELEDTYDTLLFYTRHPGKSTPNYALEMIKTLGWKKGITLIQAPTKIEHMAVPSQVSHAKLGIIHGHPLVRRLFSDVVGKKEGLPKRVYVSRSKLKPDDGIILLETQIEANLAFEGYAIFHPQEHSIDDQLAVYAHADEIIFAEGSPMHLYAYVCRPEQRIYVIWRRRVIPMFIWQMQTFSAPPLNEEPCINALWLPQGIGDPSQRAKSVLDFEKLKIDLMKRGFIKGDDWISPANTDLDEAMNAIKQSSRFNYILAVVT